MAYLLALIGAVAISIFIIPLMMWAAPRLGMIDHPDSRKVHTMPIPRVGGWGIVFGALIPVSALVPLDNLTFAYLVGSVVLMVFGTWDDIHELGHYTKFIGQLIAVSVVVFFGDLYITSFPLLGQDALSPMVGKAFTVFAMVGGINAINHSDGLDGLAGGEALFSLLGIALLIWAGDGAIGVLIAIAAVGGVIGFLRYNTHPAHVFMGDGGSQFLGFTLGFLVVLLTQRVDPNMSPAVVLLLLGLPIADILAVLVQRIYQGNNWFRASKNHIHHRLLKLGVVHRNSVILIYSVQALLVLSGVVLRYEPDELILLIYVATCLAIFGLLAAAEELSTQGRLQPWLQQFRASLDGVHAVSRDFTFWSSWATRLLALVIPAYLLISSAWVRAVPHDLGIAALVLFGLVLMSQPMGRLTNVTMRMASYGAAVCTLFLNWKYPPEHAVWWTTLQSLYLLILAPVVLIAMRGNAKGARFGVTATDYLVLLIVFSVWIVSHYQNGLLTGALLFINGAVLLYACEVLIVQMTKRWNVLSVASSVTLALLGLRALL